MGRHVDDVSLYAASILRNKRSITLDLKTPQGRELAAELIARADILVENNRPGVMERLGLGYEALSGAQPRPGDGAHQRLRPDRPVRRAPRLRRHLRGRGRRAPHDRRPRPPARTRGPGHHRLPVVGLRRLRRDDRHPRPNEDRQRAGGGRGAVRGRLHPDGAGRARLREAGPGADARGREPAVDGAEQLLPHARRRLGADRSQQPADLAAPGGADAAARAADRPALRNHPGAWQAREHESHRRHHRRMDARLRRRAAGGAAARGRGADHPGLHHR